MFGWGCWALYGKVVLCNLLQGQIPGGGLVPLVCTQTQANNDLTPHQPEMSMIVMTTLKKVSDYVFPFSYRSYLPCTSTQSLLEHSTLLQVPPLRLILQTTLVWHSTFHGFPGPSPWLAILWTIYYRLYGIKYKYRVVAVLYLQSCVRLFLDNIIFPLNSCLVWALRSLLNP